MLTIKLLTEAHSRPAMIQRLAPGLGSGDEVKSDKSTTVVDYQRDGEAEPRSITVSIPAPFVQALPPEHVFVLLETAQRWVMAGAVHNALLTLRLLPVSMFCPDARKTTKKSARNSFMQLPSHLDCFNFTHQSSVVPSGGRDDVEHRKSRPSVHSRRCWRIVKTNASILQFNAYGVGQRVAGVLHCMSRGFAPESGAFFTLSHSLLAVLRGS